MISPGKEYKASVEIIANQAGDFLDKFYVFTEFDIEKTEDLGVLPGLEEQINLVILSGK